MNASAMHDGMSVVHACEWPALATLPLDVPLSLDVVLFNVTSSSLVFFLIVPFYLPETASCVKACLLLQPVYVRCMLRGISADPVLFSGINTSFVFFRLHSSPSIFNICVGQRSALDPFCGVTYTAHIT